MRLLDRLNPFRGTSNDDGPRQAVSDDRLNQILDSLSTGDFSFDFFDDQGVGRNLRNAALGFAAYYRAVTLLSSVMSQILTNGSLRVVDRDGAIVRAHRTARILGWFDHSPDDATPAHEFWEDACAEYLIEGNSLFEIRRGLQNRIIGLGRLSGWDAESMATTGGELVYRARRIGETSPASLKEFAASNVAHARWPRVLRHSASATVNRWSFAPPPVRMLRLSLEIGLSSNRYIKDFYRDGGKATLGIAPDEDISADEIPEVIELINSAARARNPIVMPKKATFSNLATAAANKDQALLLEFVVAEVARVYGVPGPIIGQNVTQWGQGIESLSRLFWKYCIKQHVNRMLAPLNFRLLEPGQRFEVDPIDILRGDIQPLAAFIQAVNGDAQREQLFTREEIRRMAGAPIEPEHGTLRSGLDSGAPVDENDNNGESE